MPILDRKKTGADLRRNYVVNLQIGLLLSLGILIFSFSINFNPDIVLKFPPVDPEFTKWEDYSHYQSTRGPAKT